MPLPIFTADDAVAWAERGEKVVLVRLETSPEDITGMKAAQDILTVRGGMTSHAAVVLVVWVSAAYQVVATSTWTKRTRSSHLLEKSSTR